MIDHIGIDVRSAELARSFYLSVLNPLGYELVEEKRGWIGFGPPGRPLFWFHETAADLTPVHVAFSARNRAAVDAFHAAALAAGARDNGAPGLRKIYHPEYYGAFVLDPDGHNIEAVCHAPE